MEERKIRKLLPVIIGIILFIGGLILIVLYDVSGGAPTFIAAVAFCVIEAWMEAYQARSDRSAGKKRKLRIIFFLHLIFDIAMIVCTVLDRKTMPAWNYGMQVTGWLLWTFGSLLAFLGMYDVD